MGSIAAGLSASPELVEAIRQRCGLPWTAFVDLVIEIDSSLISKGLKPNQRPMHIALEISKRAPGYSMIISSTQKDVVMETVHHIFSLMYGPESLHSGPIYVGAIMIRDAFFEVYVPMAFGTAKINFWDHVKNLRKDQIELHYQLDPAEFQTNTDQLIDIFDYAWALVDEAHANDRFSEFLTLSKEQIEGACRTLQGSFSHRVAVQGVIYAVELGSKALLSKQGYDDEALIKLGHDLKKLVRAVGKEYSDFDLPRAKLAASKIPKLITERYSYTDLSRVQIGNIIRYGQFILGEFGRVVSDRNFRTGATPPMTRTFPA